MSAPAQTKVWILQTKPTDHPVLAPGPAATFALETRPLPALQDGQLLLKTRFLSNDPAQRTWIDGNSTSSFRSYAPPVPVGAAMRARGICEVLESRAPSVAPGALVTASCDWSEYGVRGAGECAPLRAVPGVGATQFLGALGGTGLTAYVGLVKVLEARRGETVVVSGAAGATGSMVVQLARNVVGCRVVGTAGSEDKCRWVEGLGAETCVNYKDADWREQLARATEGDVDMYFDNVGGEQLDFMLGRLKKNGRIAACGAISDYNKGDKSGIKNWANVITQRLQIKGFIVLDYLGDGNAAKFVEELTKAAQAGQIRVGDENETVVETKFEDIPNTWVKLFDGSNTGKLITKIVD